MIIMVFIFDIRIDSLDRLDAKINDSNQLANKQIKV